MYRRNALNSACARGGWEVKSDIHALTTHTHRSIDTFGRVPRRCGEAGEVSVGGQVVGVLGVLDPLDDGQQSGVRLCSLAAAGQAPG
jgi:hypothetical protein